MTAASDVPLWLRNLIGPIGEAQLAQQVGMNPAELERAVGGTVRPRQIGSWIRCYPNAQDPLNVYFGLTDASDAYFQPVPVPTGDTNVDGAARFLLLVPERLAMLAEAGQGPQPNNTADITDGYQGRSYRYRYDWAELASFVERQANQPQGDVWRWRAATDLDHSRGYPA